MSIDEKSRPLKPKQRDVIRLIVYEGMSKTDAYLRIFDLEKTSGKERDKAEQRASNLFYLPHVNAYYHGLMEQIREKAIDKGVWTKEISTKKLVKLIEKAEEDIYGDPLEGKEGKQLTMGRLNAIVLPIKELNTMNGLNTTSHLNVEGTIVQIVGEADIPD